MQHPFIIINLIKRIESIKKNCVFYFLKIKPNRPRKIALTFY